MHIPLFWSGALLANVAWMFLLPSRSGKLVAALGIVVASLMVWIRWRSDRHPAPGDGPSGIVVVLFALPLTAWFLTPTLGFLRLDARLWLVLAWLASHVVMRFTHRDRVPEGNHESPVIPPLGLFAVWACVFWLLVIWDLGVGAQILTADRTTRQCQIDPLTQIFSVWSTEPASEHLFLGWRTTASFASRTPYANHVHPYLLTMYAWVAGVRAVSGAPWFVAANTSAIFYLGMILTSLFVLLARMRLLHRCSGLRGLLVIFTAVGFVVTTWRFWVDFLQFNTDNPYPLLAAMFVLVYAFLLTPARPALAVAAAVTFVALSPIHLPMLVLAVVCLFGTPAATVSEVVRRNRLVLSIVVWATVVGVVVMAAPRLLIAWKGYGSTSSDFMFRSGLDGDTTYFSSIFQAAWSACPLNCCGSPRPVSRLLVPAALPLAVFAPAVMLTNQASRLNTARMLTFLLTPYFLSVILFPQSVSIHPYLYDHLVVIPIVVVGVSMMLAEEVRDRLHGPVLLAFILFMAGVIMSNLIAIAQAIR